MRYIAKSNESIGFIFPVDQNLICYFPRSKRCPVDFYSLLVGAETSCPLNKIAGPDAACMKSFNLSNM